MLAKLNGLFYFVYLELSLEDEEERECLRLRAGDLLLLLGGGDLRLGERLRPLPERLRRREEIGDRRRGLGERPRLPPRLRERRLRGLGDRRPPPRRDAGGGDARRLGGERRDGAGLGINTGAAVIS